MKILGIAPVNLRYIITIPKDVRKYLNIKVGDKITFCVEDKKILIKREKTTYEDFNIR